MKKILLVYTGGTICSFFDGEKRSLNTHLSKTVLLENFRNSNSPYSLETELLFEDSALPKEERTLSENMTIEKLDIIARHIHSFPLDRYAGVMVMHGTDTLAFTANLLSFLFTNTKTPILLISGNHPPMDPRSNANENFCFAVNAIRNGLVSGIYVPYQNSDGKMYLHRGSTIMECTNFSDDFFNATAENVSVSGKIPRPIQHANLFPSYQGQKLQSGRVILIRPYPGLRYDSIDLEGAEAVIHGTYHSGTLCAEGKAPCDIITLHDRCEKIGLPLFICPSKLGNDQYASMFTLQNKKNVFLLNMTTTCAYMKAIAGISLGLTRESLIAYMKTDIANEMIK